MIVSRYLDQFSEKLLKLIIFPFLCNFPTLLLCPNKWSSACTTPTAWCSPTPSPSSPSRLPSWPPSYWTSIGCQVAKNVIEENTNHRNDTGSGQIGPLKMCIWPNLPRTDTHAWRLLWCRLLGQMHPPNLCRCVHPDHACQRWGRAGLEAELRTKPHCDLAHLHLHGHGGSVCSQTKWNSFVLLIANC